MTIQKTCHDISLCEGTGTRPFRLNFGELASESVLICSHYEYSAPLRNTRGRATDPNCISTYIVIDLRPPSL